jgi:hypothetical protein
MGDPEPSLVDQAILHFREHLEDSVLLKNVRPSADEPPPFELADWPSLRVNGEVRRVSGRRLLYRLSHGVYYGLLDAAQSLALDGQFCADLPVDETQIAELAEASGDVRERFVDYAPANIGAPFRFPIVRTTMQSSRQHLTDVLLALGIKYISLHEQGHAYQGHLHLLTECTGALAWLELGENEMSSGSTGIDPADLRALELQADAFASHILIIRNAERGAENLYPDSHVLRNPVDWLFFSFLSAAIVYALLEKGDLSAAIFSGEERRHPIASVRIVSAFAELRQAMFKHIEDEGQRAVFLERLLAECGVIFRLVGVQPIDATGFNSYFSHIRAGPAAPGADEVERYNARLNELSPTLHRCSAQAKQDFHL